MSQVQDLPMISIAKPIIGEAEKKAVMEVLESGNLVQGDRVTAFEQAFAEFQGVKHAIATTNGTTALTTALFASGIQPGDEVIIPSFSFIATATSILSANAVPVFVDVEPETFCMDPDLVVQAITPKTKAIMPVHLYGQPANMPALNEIAQQYNLKILEDAAQAHGAKIDGVGVGGWGAAGFSFYATKNMTSGEGGMVTTNDDEIAALARMVRNHGMNKQYYHEVVGFNFRMTNIIAAIGLAQMSNIGEWNNKRIENATYFNEHIKSVQTPVIRDGYHHVFHQYTVVVPEEADRDAMIEQLNKRGIGARVYYPLPIHCQPIFSQNRQAGNTCSCGHGLDCPHLPVSTRLSKQVFSLPVHPALTQEDRERIVYEVNAL